MQPVDSVNRQQVSAAKTSLARELEMDKVRGRVALNRIFPPLAGTMRYAYMGDSAGVFRIASGMT
jgi:hypothetical protein